MWDGRESGQKSVDVRGGRRLYRWHRCWWDDRSLRVGTENYNWPEWTEIFSMDSLECSGYACGCRSIQRRRIWRRYTGRIIEEQRWWRKMCWLKCWLLGHCHWRPQQSGNYINQEIWGLWTIFQIYSSRLYDYRFWWKKCTCRMGYQGQEAGNCSCQYNGHWSKMEIWFEQVYCY